MADGTIQVPPDSTGSKVDGASLPVGGNTVIRQRMVIGDNSATAQFATVTAGALLVQVAAGAANIGTINNISAAVVLAAGAANIGTINNISAAVVVTLPANIGIVNSISAPVVLAAGTANIGTINGISATLSTVLAAGTANIGTINNISAAVVLAAGANNIGTINGISATLSTVLAAGTANIGTINNISAAVVLAAGANNIGTINAISAAVGLAAGANNIGFINHISANVQTIIMGFKDNSGNTIQIVDSANIALRVAGYGTLGSLPIGGFIDGSGQNRNVVDSVNLALRVTVTTPLNINAISQTVTVVTALPWVVAQPSASHGPLTIVASTSAQSTLIAAPGAGQHIYITELVLTNAGTVLTGAQVGPTGSAGQVTMVVPANGVAPGRMSFDPPWKLQSNTAAVCKLDPSPGGNFYFVVNFFVST